MSEELNIQQDKNDMYRNILNECRYLKVQIEAIEKETVKGQQHDIFDGSYIAEKLDKARSALDEITKDVSLKGRRFY